MYRVLYASHIVYQHLLLDAPYILVNFPDQLTLRLLGWAQGGEVSAACIARESRQRATVMDWSPRGRVSVHG